MIFPTACGILAALLKALSGAMLTKQEQRLVRGESPSLRYHLTHERRTRKQWGTSHQLRLSGEARRLVRRAAQAIVFVEEDLLEEDDVARFLEHVGSRWDITHGPPAGGTTMLLTPLVLKHGRLVRDFSKTPEPRQRRQVRDLYDWALECLDLARRASALWALRGGELSSERPVLRELWRGRASELASFSRPQTVPQLAGHSL